MMNMSYHKKKLLKLDRFICKLLGKRPSSRRYYQLLHDSNRDYQRNNWLVDQARLHEVIEGKTVCEIGCGNGQFLKQAACRASRVIGLDWARSPELGELPANTEFVQADLTQAVIPEADVLCSGDVLEHFSKDDLGLLLKKLHEAATINFHVIACYDDNHSHLTIEPPDWWKEAFQEASGDSYDVQAVERDAGKTVAILTNIGG